ncbi:hypothetical protein ACFQ3N_00570 [Virgibacillus byunsanensis]|uniref:Uncharacterized protein n=1 Tax=Virgibacillus byunsanensis TaxID=570945 RepID=A0ABW3LGU9_9BACI
MVGIIGILVITIVIILMEVPSLLKDGIKKDIIVFFTILLLGVGVSIALTMGVKIPNPVDAIQFMYKPLSDLISNLFK